jgi:hypothetical protein
MAAMGLCDRGRLAGFDFQTSEGKGGEVCREITLQQYHPAAITLRR